MPWRLKTLFFLLFCWSLVPLAGSGSAIAAVSTLQFHRGWNNIALVVEPPTGFRAADLVQLAAQEEVLLQQVAVFEGRNWKVYRVGVPASDFPLRSGVGYLVWSESVGKVLFTGESPDALRCEVTPEITIADLDGTCEVTTIGGTGDEFTADIVTAPDGGVYWLLWTRSSVFKGVSVPGASGVVLVKLGSDLSYEWHQLYGGTGNDRPRKVRVLGDGTVVMAGTTTSPLFSGLRASGGSQVSFIVRVSGSDGAVLGGRFFGSNADESCEGMAVLSPNTFAVVGSTTNTSGVFFPPAQGTDAYLAILRNDMNIVATTSISTSGADYFRGVDADGSGGGYVSGRSNGPAGFGVTVPPVSYDLVVARFSADGQWRWIHQFITEGDEASSVCVALKCGGVMAFVQSTEQNYLGAPNAGQTDMYFVRYDEQGMFKGISALGGSGTDTPYDMAVDGKGGVWLNSVSTSEQLGGTTKLGTVDLFIANIDEAGRYLGARRFWSGANDYVLSVLPRSDGSLVLGGHSTATVFMGNPRVGGSDSFVMRMCALPAGE